MADKKEVNILLLGIVAILAIVGLVLLFTSPAATGKAFVPPQLPPSVESPASVGYGGVPANMQSGQIGNAVIVPLLEGSSLERCPNGRMRTREMGNIDYEAVPGHLCNWFYCPGVADSNDASARPIMACVRA